MENGTWIQRLEDGGELPPDIAEVIRGLWEIGYRDSGDDYDWVPSVLIRRNYYVKFPSGPNMTNEKFGIAVRLAYPPLKSGQTKRTRRRYQGKMVCGVCGLTGPGGMRTNEKY